jgi:hypothetical protein
MTIGSFAPTQEYLQQQLEKEIKNKYVDQEPIEIVESQFDQTNSPEFNF